MKDNTKKPEIPELLFVTEALAIEEILRKAVRKALLEHKRAGNSIPSWQDGQVVMIPPDQIPVDDN